MFGASQSASLPISSGEISISESTSVVVIGDIHGDQVSFERSLWLAWNNLEFEEMDYEDFSRYIRLGLNAPRKLARLSRDTVLVQMGDVIDRGPDGLACLDLLDSIEHSIGWRVVRLYGNHELLSHQGQSGPYIAAEEVAKFSERFGSENARISEFATGGSVWNSILSKSVFMARISPPLSDSNSNEQDLLPVSSVSSLFVHGGVEAHWVDLIRSTGLLNPSLDLVDGINEFAHRLMQSGSSSQELEVLQERQSPLWIRDLAQMDPEYVCEHLLPRILRTFNVARIIVGHTPQSDLRMKSLCSTRLILADASMSAWMRPGPLQMGNPSVLVMRQNVGSLMSMRALYYDQTKNDVDMFSGAFYDYVSGPKDKGPTNPAIPFIITDSEWRRFSKGLQNLMVERSVIAQQLNGSAQYAVVKKLADARIFGVPRVMHLSPLGNEPEEEFHVLLETQGRSFGEVEEKTLPMYRQVLETASSLFEAGFILDCNSLASPLEMFSLEADTELLKLIDLGSVKLYEQEDDSRKSALECILKHLVSAAKQSPSERIDWKILVAQVFGENSGIIALPSSRTRGPATVITGSYRSLIATEYTGADLELISSSSNCNLYRSSSQSIVALTNPPPKAFFDLLSSPASSNWFPNIPTILSSQPGSEPGSMYIRFDLWSQGLVVLSSVYKSLEFSAYAKVASQILYLMDCLHFQKVLLSLPDDPNTALGILFSSFLFNPAENKVWLVDLSYTTVDSSAQETALENNLTHIISLIKLAFPDLDVEIDTKTFMNLGDYDA